MALTARSVTKPAWQTESRHPHRRGNAGSLAHDSLKKAGVSMAAPHPSAPAQTHFALPLSKRAGEQHTVDVDAVARGAYVVV
jgi:Xaa-Pro aminopeptidase